MTDPDLPSDRLQGSRMVREASAIVGAGLALVVAAAWWLSGTHPAERPRFSVASGSVPSSLGDYVGTESCAGCHPGESALHSRSGHSRTLRPAAGTPLARRLAGRMVADPESPSVSWSYESRDGEFLVRREEGGAVEPFVLDYAFGSGRHATTFLTLIDPSVPAVLEHRLTYFAPGDLPDITPGQKAEQHLSGVTPAGRRPTPSVTLKCFRCHSTRTSAAGDGLDPAEMIPNVSCEQCHGPARKHVADARAGKADLRMPFGSGNWTAAAQMTRCGQCHRHPSQMAPGEIRPENATLARFQPVGLAQSSCYTKSGGAMSCVTCHDPHARASADLPRYEKACLQCHESSSVADCPVSPRGGCVGCHMPRVDSGQQILFTDHWIRVRGGRRTGGDR
jgi:hypothetical protein